MGLNGLTIGAIRYGIRELGRRAGASNDWIATWRIEVREESITVYPNPDASDRIEFAFDGTKGARFAQLWEQPASRYEQYVVPFDERERFADLFDLTHAGVARVRGDIVSASVWTLSRREEHDCISRDENGRALGASSGAHRDGYLDRPIIDEYGIGLERALRHLFPSWSPRRRSLRVKLSHDMDQVGIPRTLRTTIGHLYPRRQPRLFAQDVASAFGAGAPAYLRLTQFLADRSRKQKLDSAFYWKASGRKTAWDTGYRVRDPVVSRAIEGLMSRGFEIGLHPAYDTFGSQERLEDELAELRTFVGATPVGGRTHYLRWNAQTWLQWEKAGLAYDSTLGFHDQIGFRAGTCFPYRPWSLDEDRELQIVEIPLIVMDVTALSYLALSNEVAFERIATLVNRSRAVGGVFTLLWHNTTLVNPGHTALYLRLLDLLGETDSYVLRDDFRSTNA